MKQVKIGALRNGLSRYLSYVRRGGRVRVMDRDTPIAEIVPLPATAQKDGNEPWWREQERRGVIKPPAHPRPLPRYLFRPVRGPPSGVLDILLEDRRSGR